MKLEAGSLKQPQVIEITSGEFGSIILRIKSESLLLIGEAQVKLTQVEALSLCRIIEEQVKEVRRK